MRASKLSISNHSSNNDYIFHVVIQILILFAIFELATCSMSSYVDGNNRLNIVFPSFSDADRENLILSGDSEITQSVLQLTPDSRNNDSFLINKSGTILLKDPIKLWDSNSLASFNSSFEINITPGGNSSNPGEGLTFLIASFADGRPPPGSSGGYLGLTNSTIDGNFSNNFVAVELDTLPEVSLGDPEGEHVGLDINSVVSNVTALVKPLGIELAPSDSHNNMVWIDYDGKARHIWVYIAVQGQPKPVGTPVLNASLDVSQYVNSKSYFGFSASTGIDFELNCVIAWNLTIDKLPEDDIVKPASYYVKISIGVVIGCLVILGILGFFVMKRSSKSSNFQINLPDAPREFKYKELKKATSNFDERQKLGQGAFGGVYKGVVMDSEGIETEVAVKKFTRGESKVQGDFLDELTIINRLRHKNLVPLLGWCSNKGELLLVYEFMPNGSLDQHLFDDGSSQKPPLSWHNRYKVITGIASALRYLHTEYNQMVVHRDIKASNIMLDISFNARLGDFGLARALDTFKTSYTDLGIVGTRGYIANECCITHKFTRQSDIYAFGAVILEVVCGRRPLANISGTALLADWVWKLHKEGRILDAIDSKLGKDYDADDANRLLLLGLACSHPRPAARPSTQDVVQIIDKLMPPPVVPKTKPAFVWPVPEDDDNYGDTGKDDTLAFLFTESGNQSSDTSSFVDYQGGWTSSSYGLSSMDAEMGNLVR